MVIMEKEDDDSDDDVESVGDYHRQYKVLRQIANGAFGSVHCVQRRDTKVILAAKYVKSRNADIKREVYALKSLSKSNLILQFVSFYKNRNGIQSILVTEFLAGGDLCEKTSAMDYVLTEQKCRTIIRQIVRGVQFIHSKNFIHLDLKPFNIVFSKKGDDYDLRIIDFGIARQLSEGHCSVKIGMCGTIEYMSPEVMNCTFASTASDMWGVGVISYMLVSGGISPFFAVNRFRTMARVLDCDYSLDLPEMNKVSEEAKSFISGLLRKESSSRLTADQALNHVWLRDDMLYLGILETLETTWMRRCLARRRWYRLLNAVRVMTSIKSFTSSNNVVVVSNDDDDDEDDDDEEDDDEEDDDENEDEIKLPHGFPIYDITEYNDTFLKLHLLMNNGHFGTVYCVQHNLRSNQVYSAKEVRNSYDSIRREASILYQLRNSTEILRFAGLYEKGKSISVIVSEYLIGGDLVERTSRSDFILNERKCKAIVRQICSAMEYTHFHKIIHLDMKPFNVVFTTKDNDNIDVKVTDFNLARRLSKGTEDRLKIGGLYGTLEFMSPEVIECTGVGTATDMWGVGIIAYMLITGGKSPFWIGNRFQIMAKILAAHYDMSIPELTFISQEAKDFISELLVLNPNERLTASACLEHPWLTTDSEYVDILYTLETVWMKQLLVRRRWQRWYNAVRAMQRIRKFSSANSKRVKD